MFAPFTKPNQDGFVNFCTNLVVIPSQINDELNIYSIVTGDFNARYSKGWKNDITNFTGKEINFLTSSASYTQIIDKPNQAINNSKLCTVSIFCANENVTSKYVVDASLFDKCYHDVIYGKITIRARLPPVFICEV